LIDAHESQSKAWTAIRARHAGATPTATRPRPIGETAQDMVRLFTWAERPELAERGPASADVWPEYNRHGDVVEPLWGPLLDELPEYQFALVDEDDAVVAEGHTGPLAWDGDDAHLPSGIDDTLRQVVTARRDGSAVDTLSALAAEVGPGARGRGLAAELLAGMRELARRQGLQRLIAPVRPSWKERYPLAPIERYVSWRRPDGVLLDPWLRLHVRLGARISTPLPRSLLISGSVADWEQWTGLAFPESGAYTFPQGLATVEIDRDSDTGTYWEPNVWLVHPELGA
jgi:GNAT superfamily N-acetyltransferase